MPKEHIVIVGAGIIGVCCAYYLTQHPDFDKDKYHITILEARRPACGASGKAGGLLALWAFPQQIVPLSFNLHQELADQYDGYNEWGYRRVDTISLEGSLRDLSKTVSRSKTEAAANPTENGTTENGTTAKNGNSNGNSDGATSREKSPTDDDYLEGPSNTDPNSKPLGKLAGSTKRPEDDPGLPENLDWIAPDVVENWSSLGDTETTAQVHPYKFTNFLLKKALETGAVELVIGKVSGILTNNPNINEIDELKGVKYIDPETNKEVRLEADKVLLTAGPWTSRILPAAPISGLRAHSITIAPTRQVSPYALFTELRVKRGKYVSPEIYPRKDEIYVCGEGDGNVPVPETADEVQVERWRCDDLFKYASAVSPEIREGRLLKRQACYLPVIDIASCPGPLIGETNVDNLYLASGHSCWGINNAPATGKLVAEIILEGEAHSASLQGLEPDMVFDASDITPRD